jgi:sulfide:quinone oxidoreductase
MTSESWLATDGSPSVPRPIFACGFPADPHRNDAAGRRQSACGFPAASISVGADGPCANSHDDLPMAAGRVRVVIAGGGVAALEAMVALRDLAGELVDVTLLAPEAEFSYRPLAVAEPFDLGTVQRFPLTALAGACGAKHHPAALAAVYPAERRVRTSRLVEIAYDALLVAIGVTARQALPGALTFRGPQDVHALRALVADLEAGRSKCVAFVVPSGVAWALPLYELAFLTADRLAKSGARGAKIRFVTPEAAPLQIFGAQASETVHSLLDEKGIEFLPGKHPYTFERGKLHLVPGGVIEADVVVALPSLRGQAIPGIPHDRDDFIRTDPHGRVEGLASVYAAGDITAFPVKQGGLAAQQADAAAEAIAADAGAGIEPRPFDPVLRGLVITGGAPAYLRAELRGGRGPVSEAGREPLWWPPGKIAGRYLAPFLAEQAGLTFGARAAV